LRSPKMMTDEEILQKATLLLEKMSKKSPKKRGFGQGTPPKGEFYKKQDIYLEEDILREISDTEFRGVEAILQKIADNPEGVLAFDKLFGDKTRIVIPFPVKDNSSDLGQWVYELEQNLEVQPDYEKGMLSIDREWEDHDRPIDDDMDRLWGSGKRPKKIKKKLQMKIGRYFTKLDELVKEYHALRTKIVERSDDYIIDDIVDVPGMRITTGEEEEHLDKQELKKLNKLRNSLELYMGGASSGGVAKYILTPQQKAEWADNEQIRRDRQDKEDARRGRPVRKRKPIVTPDTGFKIMGNYWVDNAKYVKENINDLENDKYSIILTRHPVDVMRMSDFDKITSCHTPPSRTGGEQSYYKCAVAEAQGHGAIAYVVETEELLSQTNTGNIESAEQELEEYDEIFSEQNRYLHGTNLDLDPVARTRLRQLRYFRDFDGKEEPYGKELAVPEKFTYGLDIPGLVSTVTRWAREKQENLFDKLPRKDGKINLDNFEIYGGSYEDTSGVTGRKELMMNLTKFMSSDFIGAVKQNLETENDMPPEWVGDIGALLKRECSVVTEEWNPKYANCKVDFYVKNNGNNDWYIYPEGKLMLTWDVSEWKQLPNVIAGQDIADYLNQSYFDPENASGDLFDDDKGAIYRGGTEEHPEIVWRCEFNNKLVPGMGGEEIVYDADGFKHFCKGVDQLDDKRDTFQAIVEQFAKSQGWLEGHAYMSLAQKIENNEIGAYEWDVEYDKEHYTESYEAWATISYDFDPEELGIEPRILFDLVDRREFALRLRGYLTAQAREDTGGEYWLSIRDKSAVEVGGEVRYSITFKVDADTPDDLVAQFYELVTGEMDDEDEIAKAFMGALREEAAKNGVKLSRSSPGSEKARDFDALQDLGENKQYNADYLVKTWKRFIL